MKVRGYLLLGVFFSGGLALTYCLSGRDIEPASDTELPGEMSSHIMGAHEDHFDRVLSEFEGDPLTSQYRARGVIGGDTPSDPSQGRRIDGDADSDSDSESARPYARNHRDVAFLARVDPAKLSFDILPRNASLNPRDVTIEHSQLQLLASFHEHYRVQLVRIVELLARTQGQEARLIANRGGGDPLRASPEEQAQQQHARSRWTRIAERTGTKKPSHEAIDMQKVLQGVAEVTGSVPLVPPTIVRSPIPEEVPSVPPGSVIVFQKGAPMVVDMLGVESVQRIFDYRDYLVGEYVHLLTAFFTGQGALTIQEAGRLCSKLERSR